MTTFVERYLNRRIVLELAPAIVFFAVNLGWGLMVATAAVMAATVVTTAVGVVAEKRVPVLAIVTLVLVLLLGGASLLFEDELYIKIKPTVGRCLFALALAVGLRLRESLLRRAFAEQLHLTEAGWRVLTLSWIALALVFAAANEWAWRTLDTDSWVAFRTALTPASILGYIAITRLVAGRYWHEPA